MAEDFKKIRDTSFGRLNNLIANQMNQEMDKRLAEKGLSVKLFGVIMILLHEDGITQVEIASRVGIPGYATSRTLDRLETLELVTRHPDPNSRRSFLIRLTEKGKEIGKTLPALIKEVNQKILAPLNDKEQELLVLSMQKIALKL